jgi:hypothetical protein
MLRPRTLAAAGGIPVADILAAAAPAISAEAATPVEVGTAAVAADTRVEAEVGMEAVAATAIDKHQSLRVMNPRAFCFLFIQFLRDS